MRPRCARDRPAGGARTAATQTSVRLFRETAGQRGQRRACSRRGRPPTGRHHHGPRTGRGHAGSAPFAVEQRPAAPHRRDPRQPDRPDQRGRTPRLARRSRRTQDQPRRHQRQARPDRPACPPVRRSRLPQSRTPHSPHPTGRMFDFAVIMLNIRVQAPCCIAARHPSCAAGPAQLLLSVQGSNSNRYRLYDSL